uniref:Sm domain-containing protein n=1 Tax=Parascaris univalens TaxID=6257 RepID=A0A914ZWU1_PARUN
MTTLQAPYIGSKVSLVSKLGIRYEGILYAVNPGELTIALAKVRCFGTENRPAYNPVSGSDNIYEYIVFKATDIQELMVCVAPEPLIQFGYGLLYNPVVVKLPLSSTHTNDRSEDDDVKCQQYRRSNFKIGSMSSFSWPWQAYFGLPIFDNCQLSQMNAHSRMPRGGRPKDKRVQAGFNVDYDFESANRQFCKILEPLSEESEDSREKESEKEMASAGNDDCVQKFKDAPNENSGSNMFYNKNVSFFDKISYRGTKNFDRKRPQRDRTKEYMRNKQTFGEAAVRSIAYRAGRRCIAGGGSGPAGMK